MSEAGDGTLELRVAMLEQYRKEDLENNRHSHATFFQKFEDVNALQVRFDERFSSTAVTLDRLEKSVESMNSKIDGLLQAPAKKWNAVTMSAITTVIGAIIGVIVANIF